jgi:hypothetical protein
MLKRRVEYLMEMDVEVNYAAIDQWAQERATELSAMRDAVRRSLISHVRGAANEAVHATGQKWKGDEVDDSGEWPRFKVRLDGNQQGATAAAQLWHDKVQALPNAGRILVAKLHGSDGTDFMRMDGQYQQELEEQWNALSEERQDQINRLMIDPEAE